MDHEFSKANPYLRPGSNAVLIVCFDREEYTAEEKASTRATARSNFLVWLDMFNAYAATAASWGKMTEKNLQ